MKRTKKPDREPTNSVGRPRFEETHPDYKLMMSLSGNWPDIQSRAGRLNKYYELRTVRAFKGRDDFKWIFDPDPDTNTMKCQILQQLGRFEDIEIILCVAEYLTERQMREDRTVQEWADIIRDIRLQNTDTEHLYDFLCWADLLNA